MLYLSYFHADGMGKTWEGYKIKKLLSGVIIVLFLSIGLTAFADTLSLPIQLHTIEEAAFQGDTSLDDVIVSNGVTEIPAYAFADSSVRSITLPESVGAIEETAFEGCSGVTFFTWNSYTYDWAINHGFTAVKMNRNAVSVNSVTFRDWDEIQVSMTYTADAALAAQPYRLGVEFYKNMTPEGELIDYFGLNAFLEEFSTVETDRTASDTFGLQGFIPGHTYYAVPVILTADDYTQLISGEPFGFEVPQNLESRYTPISDTIQFTDPNGHFVFYPESVGFYTICSENAVLLTPFNADGDQLDMSGAAGPMDVYATGPIYILATPEYEQTATMTISEKTSFREFILNQEVDAPDNEIIRFTAPAEGTYMFSFVQDANSVEASFMKLSLNNGSWTDGYSWSQNIQMSEGETVYLKPHYAYRNADPMLAKVVHQDGPSEGDSIGILSEPMVDGHFIELDVKYSTTQESANNGYLIALEFSKDSSFSGNNGPVWRKVKARGNAAASEVNRHLVNKLVPGARVYVRALLLNQNTQSVLAASPDSFLVEIPESAIAVYTQLSIGQEQNWTSSEQAYSSYDFYFDVDADGFYSVNASGMYSVELKNGTSRTLTGTEQLPSYRFGLFAKAGERIFISCDMVQYTNRPCSIIIGEEDTLPTVQLDEPVQIGMMDPVRFVAPAAGTYNFVIDNGSVAIFNNNKPGWTRYDKNTYPDGVNLDMNEGEVVRAMVAGGFAANATFAELTVTRVS